MTLTTAVEVLPFGTLEEFQAEDQAFGDTFGVDPLSLVCPEVQECYPTWVVEWAAYLCRWDCWLFAPVPTEEYQALEALEEEVDGRYHRLTRRHRWVPCRGLWA